MPTTTIDSSTVATQTQQVTLDNLEQALHWAESLIVANTANKAEEALNMLADVFNRLQIRTARVNTDIANALMLLNRQPEAKAYYEDALAAEPNNTNALNGYGAYCVFARDFEQAETILRRSTELSPEFANAWVNLGMLLKGTGRHQEAMQCLITGLTLDPDNIQCLNNLGLLCTDIGEYAPSVAYFERAITLDAGNHMYRQNLAMAHLNHQNWAAGWLHYESRLPHMGPTRYTGFPRWIGESLPDSTLLVLPEQGFGDMFLFVRYVALAKTRVKRLVLLCDAHWGKALYRLFKHLESTLGIEVLTDGDALPLFHTYIPMASLARLYAQTADPHARATLPYIQAAPNLQADWDKRLLQDQLSMDRADTQTKRIGLVWQSGGRTSVAYDFLTSLRSLTLTDFAPLGALSQEALNHGQTVVFYSLQVGDGREQLAQPPEGMHIVDHTDSIKDFADTAALLSRMDALVSIDTSVPNLAGAMNIPTFLLKSAYPDWRWFKGPESPWYPSVRVFKQRENVEKVAEPWAAVIARMTADLAVFLKHK